MGCPGAAGDQATVISETFREAAHTGTRPGRIFVDGSSMGVQPAGESHAQQKH